MAGMDVSVPDWDERVRLQEAGHLAIAAALGYKPTGVTTRAGAILDGCATHALPGLAAGTMQDAVQALNDARPFVAWPETMRARVEALVVIKLAGQAAEMRLSERVPATVRLPATVAEQAAAEAADLPDPPAELVARYTALVDDEQAAESDADAVAVLASVAFGDDLASMHGWLTYLEGQALAMVLAESAKIRRLAGALALRPVLGGEAIAAVLAR